MKKYIITLFLSFCFSVFTETHDVKVTGKAFIKDKEGMIIELEKEDVVDDESDTLIVQPSSKVVVVLNGKTIILKNGEYKLSDIFKK